MHKKLLTLEELSGYLGIKEKKVVSLIEEGVISAYKIGGELIRFQKDQIDAIRAEIDSRVTEKDLITVRADRGKAFRRIHIFPGTGEREAAGDKISDFFYFNDFYIVSGFLIFVLLVVIFRGL
ncbi:MAG: helix-turn-helix domain-containing protein [Candidatus Omnitrophota bacterium]